MTGQPALFRAPAPVPVTDRMTAPEIVSEHGLLGSWLPECWICARPRVNGGTLCALHAPQERRAA